MKVSIQGRAAGVSYHPNMFRKTGMKINMGNCGDLLDEMPAWRVRQFIGKLGKIPDCELARMLKEKAEECLGARKKRLA